MRLVTRGDLDGLTCAVEGWPMGMAAERTAEACGLSRADLDAYAAESQRRAASAIAFEIAPVPPRANPQARKAPSISPM